MDPLANQLKNLPRALGALPAGLKLVLVVGALAAIGVAAFTAVQGSEQWQYAFTNLTAEDSAEAASTLKTAGVPFRVEAGGSALAVPASKVYDARLLLAGAGLPRGGGVGFEIFDRGDLGVSEFTQRVNLRRATEGELARTLSKLHQVRSARVHLTLPEKGLYRDQDRAPTATVVLGLQPGRALDEREIAGVRHLVSSAVPGLLPAAVTVVDGQGRVLTAEEGVGGAMDYQARVERDLEGRIVGLLGQAVGQAAVVARVTATVDSTEVQTSAEIVDPEQTAVRSERKVTQESQGAGLAAGGVAGAQANQPLAAAPASAGGRTGGRSTMEDQVRNFDVSKTTTTTVSRVPRLQRISVAVLVDGLNGAPRPAEELTRLGDLAKRAVGFDEARGDVFEISSAPFAHAEAGPAEVAAPAPAPFLGLPPAAVWGGGGLAALAVLGVLGFALTRRRAPSHGGELPITPGARVAEIEAALMREAAALGAGSAPPALGRPALADPAATLRDRARELATKDPTRAAHILRAWMAQEGAAQRQHGA